MVAFQLFFTVHYRPINCGLNKEANIDEKKTIYSGLKFLMGTEHAALPPLGLVNLAYRSDVLQNHKKK